MFNALNNLMHDCLNSHREFSWGFAFQRHSTESVSRRKEGSYDIFKTLCLLPSSCVLCNCCHPDGSIRPPVLELSVNRSVMWCGPISIPRLWHEWDSREKSHTIIFYSACTVGTRSSANGWAWCCVSTAPDLLSRQDKHVGYFTT